MSIANNNKGILILANTDWDQGWSSRKRIAEGLCDSGWKVIYSSGQKSIWEIYNEKRVFPLYRGLKFSDGVFVDYPGSFYLSWPTKHLFNNFQLYRFAKSLGHDIRKLFCTDKFIVICFHPSFQPIVDKLNPYKLVYLVYDDYKLSPGWNEKLEAQETILLERADLVVGYSELMLNRLKKRKGLPFKIMNLGVDFEFFNRAINSRTPEDLKKIQPPRIGWAGNINQKIDFKLIKNIAIAKPEYNWVFIGKQTGRKEIQSWKDCLNLPNVNYLGYKDHNSIPNYLANMDVNVMPYDTTAGTWINHGYPLKMHEYLAVGKPVISSKLSTVIPFKDIIDISNDFDDWIEFLSKRIFNDDPLLIQKRIEVARSNDWKFRISQLDNWISNL